MKKIMVSILFLSFVISGEYETKLKEMKPIPGYINMHWEEKTGKLWLNISRFDEEFLYVNSLMSGIGSNDIGLDRGQLGNSRIVYFHRIGPKVLLVQPNYRFRANSNNLSEKRAVAEGFAQSILWGFKVEFESKGSVLVDATDFFLRDAHGIISRLENLKQGKYKTDSSRSAIFLPGTINFSKNTEVEAILTYTGTKPGTYLRQVTPTPQAITVRLHHSFIELPDENYTPRKFDPRSGFYPLEYRDYAAPMDESVTVRNITRHRLRKANPEAKISEAVEPIVYYIDPGVPEPLLTAMLEGGRWWNQAFVSIGYKNAFQVKVLPEGAHPMDVRYNMIHWVHRATRGWSYGASVSDPRTGEIIKANVSLGSLRVRQDYLIVEGLLAPYKNRGDIPSAMKELALARLKQLVAHEIGHTLGLAHNYLASVKNRASVMDYPHPMITLTDDGNIFLENAYADGIGAWDKISIAYGYQDFPEGTDETQALQAIIQDGISEGLTFITDQDARPLGSAHPGAHLWDNGSDPVEELSNLLSVRQRALSRFGKNNIRFGAPFSSIQDVLVPIYLYHRYQIKAAAKVLGGLNYSYALRGDGQLVTSFIPKQKQMEALNQLLITLKPETLTLTESLLTLLPPRAFGYSRTRESFKSRTGVTFDAISLAESAAGLTCQLLFHSERAERLVQYNSRDINQPGLDIVLQTIIDKTILTPTPSGLKGEIKRAVDFVVMDHLLKLENNTKSSTAVKSITMGRIKELQSSLKKLTKKTRAPRDKVHYGFLLDRVNRYLDNPDSFEMTPTLSPPPGSPIGAGYQCFNQWSPTG